MTYKFLGPLVGVIALAASAGPAMAATVSVEVEGQSRTLAPTVVDTPASVNKDGTNSCAGNTAIGALDVATAGGWSGSYSMGSYTVETVLGESHPFGSGGYWSLYVNGLFANDSACGTQVQNGDKVLFYASDDPFAAGVGGYDEPVLIDAPATAVPGQPFTVKATETTTDFNAFPSPSTIAPAAGATVGGGAATVTTGADGTAQVTVGGGPYTLVANKGNRAPARVAGCATDGHDGFCGTTAGAPSGPPSAGTPAGCATNGRDGFCGTADKTAANAAITAIAEGAKFKQGKGPRQLAGRVAPDASGVKDVRLRLTRNDHGRCATYDGRTEKFKTIKKCGAIHGAWFSIGAKPDFTYLLPSKLSRGRYVLDVNVVDAAGNRTAALARGTSRVVFTVA